MRDLLRKVQCFSVSRTMSSRLSIARWTRGSKLAGNAHLVLVLRDVAMRDSVGRNASHDFSGGRIVLARWDHHIEYLSYLDIFHHVLEVFNPKSAKSL